MRRIQQLRPMSVALAQLIVLGCAKQSAQQDSPAQTVTEVQALVRSIADAVGRGDAGRTMDFYRRDDPTITSANDGTLERGWQEIRASTDSGMGLEGKFRLSLGSVDVTPLGPGYALAVAPVLITVPTPNGDQKLHIVWSIVARRDSTGWKIIHDHSSYQKPRTASRE
ncbi:MAG TPA: nuclear transport factor 2 family protein [Gemmatimonadaceae bacterium]